MSEYLTTEQLADRLQIPVATLYTWRHRGKGPPAVRVGRHLRYRLVDVEAYERALRQREAGRRGG